MGHPWVPALHPPLVAFHVAPLAVFAAVAVGVASHVHILETGIWGWPGACGERGKIPPGVGKAASREKYQNGAQRLDAHGENTMEKSPRELLLRVPGHKQHKGVKTPLLRGLAEDFGPGGGFPPVQLQLSCGHPQVLALGVTASLCKWVLCALYGVGAVEGGTRVQAGCWECGPGDCSVHTAMGGRM